MCMYPPKKLISFIPHLNTFSNKKKKEKLFKTSIKHSDHYFYLKLKYLIPIENEKLIKVFIMIQLILFSLNVDFNFRCPPYSINSIMVFFLYYTM
jgi:hypothetical protein